MKKFSLFFFYFLISIFAFEMFASAATNLSMTDMLCGGYRVFNSSVGKMFAVFAIVAIGVGLFMGKITWGLVFAVALGIGAIFGAPKLVQLVTGDSTPLCATADSSTTV